MAIQIPGTPPTVPNMTEELGLPLLSTPQQLPPVTPEALAPQAAAAPLLETAPSGAVQTPLGGQQTIDQTLASVPTPSAPAPASNVVGTADPSQYDIPPSPAAPQTPATDPMADLKGFEKQIVSANRAEQKIYDSMAEAERAKAAASVSAHEAQAKAAVESEARIQGLHTKVDRDVSDQLTALNDLRSSFLNEKYEPGKVDPQRASPFASDSVSRQIMAGLAVGLGGYAAGMLGGKNSALEVIENTINRDIEAQRFNIQQQERAYELGIKSKVLAGQATEQIISTLDKQFGNSMQAEDAYKTLRLEQAKSALDQIGAKNDAVLKSAPYQIMRQELEKKIAETKMSFAQTARNTAIQKTFAGVLDNPKSELPPSVLASMPKEQREAYLESRERLIPLVGEFAKDKAAGQKFVENAMPLVTAKDNIKAVMSMAKDFNKVTDVAQRELIKARLDAVLGQLRLAYTGPGAFTAEEKALVANSVGDPTKLTDLFGIEPKKLKQTVQLLDNAIKRHAQTTFANPERAMRSIDSSAQERLGVTKRSSK